MRIPKLAALLALSITTLAGADGLAMAQATDTGVPAGQPAAQAAEKIPNEACLACHGNDEFAR